MSFDVYIADFADQIPIYECSRFATNCVYFLLHLKTL